VRRKGVEFSQAVIEAAYKKANGVDQITGDPLEQPTEVDHILPVAWALLNAPDIPPSILASGHNARVVNQKTHKERHRNFDEAEAWEMVAKFRALQDVLLE